MMRVSLVAFSLIELMVVIAIVATLSVIAVPAYNNYSVRAFVTKNLPILEQLKNQKMAEYAVNGSMTSLSLPANPFPNVVGGGASTYTDTNRIRVYITFANTTAVDAGIRNKILYLEGKVNDDSSWTWMCRTTAIVSANQIGNQYLPAECIQDFSTLACNGAGTNTVPCIE